MNNFICALLLLTSTLLMTHQVIAKSAQEESDKAQRMAETMSILMREPSEAERESLQHYGAWMNDFIEYLLNHEQPYVQAIGLSQSSSILRNAQVASSVQAQPLQKDPDTIQTFYQQLGQQINTLVNNESLNIETLQILQGLCFQKELDNYCHRQALLDKQMQLYPYEMSVYLRPLQLAIEADNEELIAKLIKVMSGAQQLSMVDYLLPEFITLVKNYINDNPIPEAALLQEKNNYLLTQDLTEQQKSLLENHFNDYMPFNILISMQLALPMPSFKPLKDLCQTETAYSAECLYMAKTMLHKSNTLISKAMGHVINLAVYELNNQQDMLAASQANQIRLKKYAECINQSINQNQRFEDMFDKDYSDMWLTAVNELTRLNNIATYLYQKRLTEDTDNARDPQTCAIQ